jgi:hypothetical protein
MRSVRARVSAVVRVVVPLVTMLAIALAAEAGRRW